MNMVSTDVGVVYSADVADRAEIYEEKSTDFQAHSKKMTDTANSLAKSGVITDRKLANDILSTSKKVILGWLWLIRLRTGLLIVLFS